MEIDKLFVFSSVSYLIIVANLLGWFSFFSFFGFFLFLFSLFLLPEYQQWHLFVCVSQTIDWIHTIVMKLVMKAKKFRNLYWKAALGQSLIDDKKRDQRSNWNIDQCGNASIFLIHTLCFWSIVLLVWLRLLFFHCIRKLFFRKDAITNQQWWYISNDIACDGRENNQKDFFLLFRSFSSPSNWDRFEFDSCCWYFAVLLFLLSIWSIVSLSSGSD